MELWGKELTREDAIARISELQLDEIEELENEYGLNEED